MLNKLLTVTALSGMLLLPTLSNAAPQTNEPAVSQHTLTEKKNDNRGELLATQPGQVAVNEERQYRSATAQITQQPRTQQAQQAQAQTQPTPNSAEQPAANENNPQRTSQTDRTSR